MSCCVALLSRYLAPAPDSISLLDDFSGSGPGASSGLLPPRPVRENLDFTLLVDQRLVSSAGGSCDIYFAKLEGEAVAVKLPKSSSDAAGVQDLLREGEILAQVSAHRHILRLLGRGQHPDGRPFLVLERLASTLADALPKPCIEASSSQPTEPDEVGYCEWAVAAARWPMHRGVHVAYGLALALRHLHEGEPIRNHRVLHRDLKPDNIGFLQETGGVVLFDFGLASRWRIRHDADDENGTARGAAGTPVGDQIAAAATAAAEEEEEKEEIARPLTGQTGSTRYMSPECCLARPYGPPSEVFSFGTILWQLLAHERPFRGFNVAAFERRVAQGGERPQIPRGWPAGLRSILTDCWRTDPRERPRMGEVVERLEDVLRDLVQAGGLARSVRGPRPISMGCGSRNDVPREISAAMVGMELALPADEQR